MMTSVDSKQINSSSDGSRGHPAMGDFLRKANLDSKETCTATQHYGHVSAGAASIGSPCSPKNPTVQAVQSAAGAINDQDDDEDNLDEVAQRAERLKSLRPRIKVPTYADGSGAENDSCGSTDRTSMSLRGRALTAPQKFQIDTSTGKRQQGQSSQSPGSIRRQFVPSLCDLVWAKQSSYPWWPALVCNDPVTEVHLRKGAEGRIKEIHVQFFEKPSTRSWIAVGTKNLSPFHGPDPPKLCKKLIEQHKESLEAGVTEALIALQLPLVQRSGLIDRASPAPDHDIDDQMVGHAHDQLEHITGHDQGTSLHAPVAYSGMRGYLSPERKRKEKLQAHQVEQNMELVTETSPQKEHQCPSLDEAPAVKRKRAGSSSDNNGNLEDEQVHGPTGRNCGVLGRDPEDSNLGQTMLLIPRSPDVVVSTSKKHTPSVHLQESSSAELASDGQQQKESSPLLWPRIQKGAGELLLVSPKVPIDDSAAVPDPGDTGDHAVAPMLSEGDNPGSTAMFGPVGKEGYPQENKESVGDCAHEGSHLIYAELRKSFPLKKEARPIAAIFIDPKTVIYADLNREEVRFVNMEQASFAGKLRLPPRKFQRPSGLALSSCGTRFAVRDDNGIHIFAVHSRKYIASSIPLEDSCHSFGLAAMPDKTFVTIDDGNKCLLQFCAITAALVRILPLPLDQMLSVREEHTSKLRFVHVDSSGLRGPTRIAISDYGNHRVAVLNEDAKFQYSFGEPGLESGCLMRPAAVMSFPGCDEFIVTNSQNNRFEVFDGTGMFKYNFSIVGTRCAEWVVSAHAPMTAIAQQFGGSEVFLGTTYQPPGIHVAKLVRKSGWTALLR